MPSDLRSPMAFLKRRISSAVEIREVSKDKKKYLALLMSADEQEDMIDRYIERGRMFVLWEDGAKGECVITDEGNGVLEIKNIAVLAEYRRKGYGRVLIDFIISRYEKKYTTLQVGTGDSPMTVPFYEKCGFVRSHEIKDFFIDNYDHPIYEAGVRLKDMIYLRRSLSGREDNEQRGE